MKTKIVKRHEFSDNSMRLKLPERAGFKLNYLIYPFFLGYEEIGLNYYNEMHLFFTLLEHSLLSIPILIRFSGLRDFAFRGGCCSTVLVNVNRKKLSLKIRTNGKSNRNVWLFSFSLKAIIF